jgi:hypothetical protein
MDKFLNNQFIQEKIVQKDVWAEGHGYIEKNGYLGTSILYYALAYMLPAKVAVVLGSGAGFVPRLIRQAQREIPDETFAQLSRCILVDAGIDEYGFGIAEYHDSPSHFFHATFPDIEIWKMTTDEALNELIKENISIDFLHIDANHTFQQSLKDFENYLKLMSYDFAITLHDTAVNHLEHKWDGCVAHTIAHLRKEMQSGGKYEHLEMINFNNRFMNGSHFFEQELKCRGTAIIKPKTRTLWDSELGELFF